MPHRHLLYHPLLLLAVLLLAGCPTEPGLDPAEFAVWRLDPGGGADAAFGTGGRVVVRTETRAFEPAAVAVQPDGRLVLAGTDNSSPAATHALVVRLRADGSLDPSFGTDGVARLGARAAGLSALALQPDGRIVVAGWANRRYSDGAWRSEVLIARLLPDGSPDAEFGQAGEFTLDRGAQPATAHAVAVAPDGSILAANNGWSGQGFALRLLADGRPDAGFGSGGLMPLDWGPFVANPRAEVLPLPDGGVLVAGGAYRGLAAVRLRSDGTPDPAFGEQGWARIDWEVPNQNFAALLRRPDGRLLLVGEAESRIAVAALTADGRPDPGFGDNGHALLQVPGDYHGMIVKGAVLLPDGALRVAANRVVTPRLTALLAGFTAAGAPDASLGEGGWRIPAPGEGMGYSAAEAVALTPNGRLVLVGNL